MRKCLCLKKCLLFLANSLEIADARIILKNIFNLLENLIGLQIFNRLSIVFSKTALSTA